MMVVALFLVHFSCSTYAVTQSYQLQHFEQLVLAGHYQANFTQANHYVVSVTAKNLDNIHVAISGNKIIVKQKSQFPDDESLFRINISAPVLTHATLSGNYQANFILPNGKSFALDTRGQGDVTLMGKFKRLSINNKGSLIMQAKNACAQAIEVRSLGNLNAIFCADSNAPFNRTIIGRADITIYGKPMFEKALGFGAVNIRSIQADN